MQVVFKASRDVPLVGGAFIVGLAIYAAVVSVFERLLRNARSLVDSAVQPPWSQLDRHVQSVLMKHWRRWTPIIGMTVSAVAVVVTSIRAEWPAAVASGLLGISTFGGFLAERHPPNPNTAPCRPGPSHALSGRLFYSALYSWYSVREILSRDPNLVDPSGTGS